MTNQEIVQMLKKIQDELAFKEKHKIAYKLSDVISSFKASLHIIE